MVKQTVKDKIRKYGWLIYIIFIVTILLLTYIDIKNSEDTDPVLGQVFEIEEVTPISNLTCIDCHSNLGNIDNQNLTIPGGDWFTSTHREAGIFCSDCHGGDPTNISGAMSGDFIGKPDRNRIPRICGNCHFDVYSEYKNSIHSAYIFDPDTKGTILASVCTDCHGMHHIERSNNPESPVYVLNSPHTCAKCHETKYYSYQDTYHGAYLVLGGELVATCDDCHGYHGIMPAVEPSSSIHPDNLPSTCAKCHDNDLDINIAQGYVHNEGELGEREEVYYFYSLDLREIIPFVYKILIVLTVCGLISLMFLENFGKGIGKRVSSWKNKRNMKGST